MRRNLSAYKANLMELMSFRIFFLIYQILGSTFVYTPLLYGIFSVICFAY